MSDGDWVEGKPQWWWKYVFPAEKQFWASVLENQAVHVASPHPEPWHQATIEIMQGVAMINATASMGKSDVSERLRAEGVAKIVAAANKVS